MTSWLYIDDKISTRISISQTVNLDSIPTDVVRIGTGPLADDLGFLMRVALFADQQQVCYHNDNHK